MNLDRCISFFVIQCSYFVTNILKNLCNFCFCDLCLTDYVWSIAGSDWTVASI